MINPERLCQDFMQMQQSTGRLARVLSHYGTVLKLSNAPSAQAPQSPRVALSEPCSWRVEGAPSCIVLICHESEAGLPNGSYMLARWSPQTAAPPLIRQMGAKMASLRNKHPRGKEREPLPIMFSLFMYFWPFFPNHSGRNVLGLDLPIRI